MKVTIECDEAGISSSSEDKSAETWGDVTRLFIQAVKGYGYEIDGIDSDNLIDYMHTMREEAAKRRTQ